MDPYERLKAEMPNIAKAVNEFKSEPVQELAFEALIRALGGGDPAAPDTQVSRVGSRAGTDEPTGAKREKPRRHARAKVAGGGKGASKTKATPVALDKTLNLRRQGIQPFKDFVAEKKPKNNHDRNVVAVYYLEKIASEKVNANKVYTCYKDAGWRVPPDQRNSLQVTASQKAFVDTSDMDSITVTPIGENWVEHDLPAKAKE
jgi:hypothetical protein